jgi:hypothetical protein
MPALRNVKHEMFAQHISTSPKTGWSQGRCYTEAGFKTEDRSADACAARLLTNANIQARIAELVEPTVRKTRATVDTLASQFDEVFAGAMMQAQFGAAGAAAAAKAKLLGFMRERIEVGAAGEFDQCETIDDIVRAFLADQKPRHSTRRGRAACRPTCADHRGRRAVPAAGAEQRSRDVAGVSAAETRAAQAITRLSKSTLDESFY